MSTILVVDDMAVFREPIAAALRQQGYQAVCAENGREALGAARTHRPDLILLDVAMPVMDGLKFLEAMRQDPNLSQIPVILLTAISERDSVLQAGKLGASDYLLKSQFSLADMFSRVKNRLEQSPSRTPTAQEGQDPEPPKGSDKAEEDVDLEVAGTFSDSDANVPPTEGLEDLGDEMTAAQILEHVANSPELQTLASQADVDSAGVEEEPRQ